ncbi:MAG: hypothetical protein IJD67_04515 [Clostridia bacterium]|nr:hypothetical protein [Clostridia bacterium]
MKKKNIFLSFWAFVIYALVIFVITTYFLMGALSSYLAEYEEYQPTTLTNKVLSYFEALDADSLMEISDGYDMPKPEAFKAYIDRFVDKETLFCYRSSVSDDRQVYDYISKNRKLASLTLIKSEEKSPRGFDVYKIDSIVWHPLMKYTITLPDACRAYINGSPLSQTKAVKTGSVEDDSYKKFDGYVYSAASYEIDYFEYITDLKAELDGAAELIIDKAESEDGLEVDYTIRLEMPQDMRLELEKRATEATKAYIYYTTLHSIKVGTVLPYIHPKAPLYKNIQNFNNTWNHGRSSDEFTKLDISDFVYYTDTRASLSVSAVYTIHKWNETLHFDFDYELFFVKEGGVWYITSMERIIKDK